MSIKIELDDWTQVEIDNWTSEKGNVFMTIRQLKRGKDGKYFPQKTKSGGFSALALRIEQWTKVAPRLIEFLRYMNADENELGNMIGRGASLFCSECGQEITGGKILCSECLIKMSEESEDRDDEF